MSRLMEFARERVLSFLGFEGAKWFDRDGLEHVRFDTQLEALEVALDESILSATKDVCAYLRTETMFITMGAYEPLSISHERERWAEGHADWLRDSFIEEYGTEDGEDGLSEEDDAELQRRLLEVVDWYIAKAKVYPCNQLRTWTFDREDIMELVEQLRPEWLVEKRPWSEG